MMPEQKVRVSCATDEWEDVFWQRHVQNEKTQNSTFLHNTLIGDLFMWLTSFFQSNPNLAEKQYRVDMVTRLRSVQLKALIINMILLVGFICLVSLHPQLNKYSFSVAVVVHCSIWLLLTVMVFLFLLLLVADKQGKAMIRSVHLLGLSVHDAWVELGWAILLTRVLMSVGRIARYGTYLSLAGGHEDGGKGEKVAMPLCLEEAEMWQLSGNWNGIDYSAVDAGSGFTYMFLLIMLDSAQTLIFSSVSFPIPWACMLSCIEMMSQLLRVCTCGSRIGSQLLIQILCAGIVGIFMLIFSLQSLGLDRSYRESRKHRLNQQLQVEILKKAIHMCVDEIKPALHLLLNTVEAMNVEELMMDGHADAVKSSGVLYNGSTPIWSASKMKEYLEGSSKIMSAASSKIDELLFILRAESGDYVFDDRRDSIYLRDFIRSICEEESEKIMVQCREQTVANDAVPTNENVGNKACLVNVIPMWNEEHSINEIDEINGMLYSIIIDAPDVIIKCDRYCLSSLSRLVTHMSLRSLLDDAVGCTGGKDEKSHVCVQLFIIDDTRETSPFNCEGSAEPQIPQADEAGKNLKLIIDLHVPYSRRGRRYGSMGYPANNDSYTNAMFLTCRRLVATTAGLGREGLFEASSRSFEGGNFKNSCNCMKCREFDEEVKGVDVLRWKVVLPCTVRETTTVRGDRHYNRGHETDAILASDHEISSAVISVTSVEGGVATDKEMVTKPIVTDNDVDDNMCTTTWCIVSNDVNAATRIQRMLKGLYLLIYSNHVDNHNTVHFQESVDSLCKGMEVGNSNNGNYSKSISNHRKGVRYSLLPSRYEMVALTNADDCMRMRGVPILYRGRIVLFSNDVTSLTLAQRESIDFVLPLNYGKVDLIELRKFLSSSRSRIERRKALKDKKEYQTRQKRRLLSDHQSVFKSWTAPQGHELWMYANESYTKWRLINPGSSWLHHTEIISFVYLIGLFLSWPVYIGTGDWGFLLFLSTIPVLIMTFRGTIYRNVLRPLHIRLWAVWLIISIAALLILARVIYVNAEHFKYVGGTSQSTAQGRSEFHNGIIHGIASSEYISELLFRVLKPHVIYYPIPYIYLFLLLLAVRTLTYIIGLYVLLEAEVVLVMVWVFSNAILVHILMNIQYELTYISEFITYEQSLRSSVYLECCLKVGHGDVEKAITDLIEVHGILQSYLQQHAVSSLGSSRSKSLNMTIEKTLYRQMDALHCSESLLHCGLMKLKNSLLVMRSGGITSMDGMYNVPSVEDSFVLKIVDEVVRKLVRTTNHIMETGEFSIETIGIRLMLEEKLMLVLLHQDAFKSLLLSILHSVLRLMLSSRRRMVGGGGKYGGSSMDMKYNEVSGGLIRNLEVWMQEQKEVSASEETPLAFSAVRMIKVSIFCPQEQLMDVISNFVDHSVLRHAMNNILELVAAYYGEYGRRYNRSSPQVEGLLFDSQGSNESTSCEEEGSHVRWHGSTGKVLLAGFMFPFKLSRLSYRAEQMLRVGRLNKPRSHVGTVIDDDDGVEKVGYRVINYTVGGSDRHVRSLKMLARAHFCKRNRIRNAHGECTPRLFKEMQHHGLHHTLCFYCGLNVYNKVELLQLQANLQCYGWQMRNYFPVSLQGQQPYYKCDVLLIDSSVDVRESEEGNKVKDPYLAVGVMNIIMSARINGYCGLIVLLCEGSAEYEGYMSTLVGSVGAFHPDLVLIRPLLRPGLRAICVAYNDLMARRLMM